MEMPGKMEMVREMKINKGGDRELIECTVE
jgi:hypothetical protein